MYTCIFTCKSKHKFFIMLQEQAKFSITFGSKPFEIF